MIPGLQFLLSCPALPGLVAGLPRPLVEPGHALAGEDGGAGGVGLDLLELRSLQSGERAK